MKFRVLCEYLFNNGSVGTVEAVICDGVRVSDVSAHAQDNSSDLGYRSVELTRPETHRAITALLAKFKTDIVCSECDKIGGHELNDYDTRKTDVSICCQCGNQWDPNFF